MMDNFRTHPLYQRAREVAGQPIDWDNPTLARLQYEMRVDYVEHMPTLNLISTVMREHDDTVAWMMTLTEIMAQPEQVLSYDDALGQGRN